MFPDYATLRQEAGFSWDARGSQDAIRALTGVPIREFNLDPEACVEAYRRGRPLLRERFGEDVGLPGLSTPAISYGHINGLGSELRFPEGGEVAPRPCYGSLEEGISRLKKPVDFSREGLAPFYLDVKKKMERAFPGETVHFAYGLEGPVTTAYLLRGQDFLTDLMDRPRKSAEFLDAVTRSILDFQAFRCSLTGSPTLSPTGAGLCDDCASMVPPRLWDSLVLPHWNRYYGGMTTGKRFAHVEDLRPSQLPLLEKAGLWRYDPSISPQLTPETVRDRCRVPFAWRLGSFHYRDLSAEDVRHFVLRAEAAQASRVFTIVAGPLCQADAVPKVLAFVEACKEAQARRTG